MFEQVWSLESKQGASFRSLFGPSLTVGTLSLRRVYQKAIDYEKARMGGRLSPFGFSTFTVAATVANTKAMEVSSWQPFHLFLQNAPGTKL